MDCDHQNRFELLKRNFVLRGIQKRWTSAALKAPKPVRRIVFKRPPELLNCVQTMRAGTRLTPANAMRTHPIEEQIRLASIAAVFKLRI